MSERVHVIVKITARPEAAAEMRAVVLALAQESCRENGCLRYDALQNEAEPHVFVLVEEWASAAALDAHNTTAHVQDAIAQAQAFAAAAPEIGRYALM